MRRLLLLLLCLLLPAAALADQTLTFTFVGDCTLGSEEYRQNAEDALNAYVDRCGYDYFFQNVQFLMQHDDLTIINLESVLSDNAYGENKNKTYRFRGPTHFTEILTRSGIELCTLANNHTADYGSIGLNATHQALDAAGVGWCADEDIFLFEKDGVKVAFIAMVSSSFFNNREWYKQKVKSLKEEDGVNAVILCFHGGSEYNTVHNKYQENYARIATDAGTDLVIMHHPHVLQGITVMNNRYVCYSLGNFVFGGNCKVRALETMAVQAALTFDDEGVLQGSQLFLYPMHVSDDPVDNHYQPCLVTGEEAEQVLKLVQADSTLTIPAFDEETGRVTMDYLPAFAPAE